MNPVLGVRREKECHGIIKGVDRGAYTIDAIVSTKIPDRDREIILPSAFAKRIDRWKRNPQYLWSHDPRQLRNHIGRGVPESIKITPEGFGVRFDCSKAVKITDDARIAFEMVEAEILNMFSVGFIPHAWVFTRGGSLPPEIEEELKGVDLSEVDCIYTDVELVEISLVGIGSNPGAFVVGRELGSTPTDVKALIEALEQLGATTARSGGSPNAVCIHEVRAAAADTWRVCGSKKLHYYKEMGEEPPWNEDGKGLSTMPTTKMPHEMRDHAVRLRAAADSLDDSKWLDGSPAQKSETLKGVHKAISDVADRIKEMCKDDEEMAAPPAVGKAARAGKEGRVISADNAERIKAIHKAAHTIKSHAEAIAKDGEVDLGVNDVIDPADPDAANISDDPQKALESLTDDQLATMAAKSLEKLLAK